MPFFRYQTNYRLSFFLILPFAPLPVMEEIYLQMRTLLLRSDLSEAEVVVWVMSGLKEGFSGNEL